MKFKRTNDAFTILELLVGVGILGILTAIAIPSFERKISRSRQQQAKTLLAAIHMHEDTYFTEMNTYTMCLQQIGFDLTNERKLWYSIGMYPGGGNANCGPLSDSTDCLAYKFGYTGNITASCAAVAGQIHFNSNTCVDTGFSSCIVPMDSSFPRATRYAFTAQARGNISTHAAYDGWSIDHNKTLSNHESGL